VSSHRSLRSLIISIFLLAAVLVIDRPAPSSAAASPDAVTVALDGLTPAVAVKGSTLHLKGSVIGGSAAHDEVTIRLAVAALQVRSEMSSSAGVGSDLVYGYQDELGPLAAKATAPWKLEVPVSAFSPTNRTIYALDVEAYSDGERIGVVRTYLPYGMTGDSSFHATQLVILWPVTAAPALDGQSSKDVPEAVDDKLSAQFAPNGRLGKTLSAAAAAPKNVTMSWAVDPDLLATANSQSHGYSLYPNGTTGAGAQNALSWLSTAKAVLGGNASGGAGSRNAGSGNPGELWQLPASDPDLASLTHASSGFATRLLAGAAADSATTVADLTGRSPLGTLAWPAESQADSATLELAKALDPSAVILGSDSAGLHTPLESYTPTGRANAHGEQLAISDAALDAIFDGDSADAALAGSDRSLLAAQRFLAQSALMALEQPNLSTPRTVMVTGSRTAAPDPALLDAVGEAGWMKTVGLSTLLGAKPDSHAKLGDLKRDGAVAQSDLTAGQLAATAALSRSREALSGILTQPDPAIDLFTPAVLRTVSTAWRSAPAQQAAFAGAVQGRLATAMNLVNLVQKSDLTLSGKSGVIPFTVENRFSFPVKVGISITTDRAGLTVQRVTLQTVPQGSTPVNVHVSSAVSGTRVRVTAQLVTPDGAPYGEPQSLQVTVSSIGSVTLVIFGLSAALLVVAVVLRIYRGRRNHSAPTGPDPHATPADTVSVDTAAAADGEREQ
jgi:uncharacterized protein DUF6049